MQSSAKREHIVRVGAWLILALALMPNISYMGHWPQMSGASDEHRDVPALPADPGELDAETEAHAAHCHVGPAHCGGGESMIGTPFVGDDTQGFAPPGYENQIDAMLTVGALSGHGPPILQPPQSA